MTFVVDIDDTLLIPKKRQCEYCKRIVYYDSKPIKSEIEMLNSMYDAGHIIILHTGRNWDCYEITKSQLKEHNIKHHELVMGKPQGIYVDRTQSIDSLEEYKNITWE
jgi:uncharacterized HAD superfamily protein